MAWNDNLDPQSAAFSIASSDAYRLRVVAGPGTGKSFAMKRRVARLLETNTPPDRILPVTFTRVAAEDLHRELTQMNVLGCDELKGTTLHSLCLRMLMRNHVLAATGRTARPLNDFELEPMVSDLKRPDRGKRAVERLRQAYEAAWARLQHETPGYVQRAEDAEFSADLLGWLRFHRAMLIGEVVPQLYQYLRNQPGAVERTEFEYILVDEFQDLNRAEQGVIELLSDAAHVCIVGDDDQSIYSFRHAHPEGIREWTNINPAAVDEQLTECRRCPTRVVRMANSLISHNLARPEPRQLVPLAGNGEGVVQTRQYRTLDQEVHGVANLITDLISTGTPPGDILVLAQRGVIGTPLYTELKERFVPVKSYYTESELEFEDTQRRFSLLKIFVDREDRAALRWLLGCGDRNWNAAGYRRLRSHCEATGDTPWHALEKLASGEISVPYTARLVESFNQIRSDLSQLDLADGLGEVVDILLPPGDDTSRDLRELALSVMGASDGSPQEFLSGLIQAIAKPEVPSDVHEVRIMSLHKSKGLSAPVTIICGCVQGLLPKLPDPGIPAVLAQEIIEEQRRLFFVGITRVKSDPHNGKPGTLILTYASTMPLRDALGAGISPASRRFHTASLHASMFLQELGPSAPHPVVG